MDFIMLQINKFSVITFIPLFISMVQPSLAFALATDREQPIKIKADKVSIDEKTGVSLYVGNVTFTQGSLILKGSKVVIHQTDGGVSKIIASGKPATFQQQQDSTNELIQAQAGKMEYITKDERVYLSQDASISQGDNLLKGNEIEFNTHTSTVTAKKSDANTNRVHIVIEPSKNPLSSPEKTPQKKSK